MRAVFAVLLSLTAASAIAAPPIRPPVVEYKIDVTLDPASKKLKGNERIVWRNPSDDVVTELQFHLYLNAFRNKQTTFMKESGGGRLRDTTFDDDANAFGSIDLRSMKVVGGPDLLPRARFIWPDTHDPEDRTVMSVPLPQPVPPRGSITLDITFDAKLPKVFARTGFVRDFFFVGQWFPKLGVYEPAGMRHRTKGGWNTHQFHANSEFYADFGDYDVTITLPSKFVVGATGNQVAKTTKGALTTYRFVEHNVHDFAWTADPRYVVRRYTFDPKRDVPSEWIIETAKLLDVPVSALQLKPVKVTMLLQPDHLAFEDRYRESLNGAIAWCGLRYGVYPYESLTLVDTPEDGEGASGMEYPGIFTGVAFRAFARWPLDNIRVAEVTAIHEFAHEYWYGMVASNEFEESWMDEGLASYTEAAVMDSLYGDQSYAVPGLPGLTASAYLRLGYLRSDRIDPIVTHSWKYAPGSYGTSSYSNPAMILRQIENDIGPALFARGLRAYFEEWSFRHPDTLDFFATMERATGRDLRPYRDGVFFGTKSFDFYIESASSRRDAESKPARHLANVVVARTGELAAGADVVVTFEDGHRSVLKFPAKARWVRWQIRYKSPMARVEVDPEVKNMWDRNLLNNSKVLQRNGRAANAFTARVQGVTAQLIQLVWGLF